MAAALTAGSQELLDTFVPAPSLADALDPTAEAKGRAIAAGVEDGTPHAMPGELLPGGTPWVWLVLGGTRTPATFVALVSTDERRAWEVAADAVRYAAGVRVERHPLI